MFSRVRRTLARFFNKSRKINHEPINKVSLIVIILVDLFILFNVFAGLDDISRWPLSPAQTYPCYSPWQSYRNSPDPDKDYSAVRDALLDPSAPLLESYHRAERGHLGSVASICEQYASASDPLAASAHRDLTKQINDVQAEINSFESAIATIRAQYDSTLLEEIAGQPRDQSINAVEAAEARAEIANNEAAIAQRKTKLTQLKQQLVNTPEGQQYLALLKDAQAFSQAQRGYQQASFWYPSLQLFFQGLFLLPLIALASTVHRWAQRRDYGYIALISWHLLAIFIIPLIWKIFEFLQIGFLIELVADLVEAIFGGLRFLLNYLQILLIPVIGFAIIKFFQKVVFNTRLQAAGRVQKMRCVRCARKLRKQDLYCPHCSYPQFQECSHCHNLTYQHLPYCNHCGTQQPLEL